MTTTATKYDASSIQVLEGLVLSSGEVLENPHQIGSTMIT